jgi:hypothetical protein
MNHGEVFLFQLINSEGLNFSSIISILIIWAHSGNLEKVSRFHSSLTTEVDVLEEANVTTIMDWPGRPRS